MDKIKTTPKDFFLQLGVMVTLYVSVISLINLLFQTINYAFPDALAYYGDPYSSGIRIAIASLLIIFPLFIVLSYFAGKDMRQTPEKRELPVRKWLIYLTLFVAGVAAVIDLIVLINTFLGGEITTRFSLKVLVVLVVAGGVFGYFIYDLKKANALARQDKLFAWLAAIVVLVSIIGGFLIMGTPGEARAQRFDDQRVSDLQNIQWQMVNFWQLKQKLPATLAELEDPISGFRIPVDPDTNTTYEYSVTGQTSFSLCATFSRDNVGEVAKLTGRTIAPVSVPETLPVKIGGLADNWEHAAGKVCFTRTIDPEKYPPIKQIKY
ncbi:MAG: DUF5671 domain-containing protein [Candidatus Paceibacterota bacterium]|jgi:hypothetical protein